MMIIPFVFLGLALSAGMGCGNSAAPNFSTFQLFNLSTGAAPYGLCAHLPRHDSDFRRRECASIADAGATTVRFGVSWRSMQKAPDAPLDFSKLDAIVTEAAEQGLTILPILYWPPKWAQPIYEHLDEYAAFIGAVVARYGERFPAIEIWNEENLLHFWGETPDPEKYAAVLKAAYQAAKKAGAEFAAQRPVGAVLQTAPLVYLGGTAGVPLPFIEGIYRAGGGAFFDAMNVHPYSHPNPPEGDLERKLENLRALMAKYGDAEKPIVITEHGWPTHKMGIPSVSLLLAGLKTARPDLARWRVAYATTGGAGGDIAAALEEVLPAGSTAEECGGARLRERLAAGDVDAVIYPFDETFPSETFEDVLRFVKEGGTLVDFGGVPLWMRCAEQPDGSFARVADGKSGDPLRRREALRIDCTGAHRDPSMPAEGRAFPTAVATAAGFKGDPAGERAFRYFTPRLLQPGDTFIPLMEQPAEQGFAPGAPQSAGLGSVPGASAPGRAGLRETPLCAACVIRFGGDFKGSLVLSGLKARGKFGTNGEENQARYLARAMAIAFAEGVERYFWYEYRSVEKDPTYSEDHFGIVHADLAPKPARAAYRAFTEMRPAGSVQRSCPWRDDARGLYFPQWTRPDGAPAGMIWKNGATACMALRFSPSKLPNLQGASAPNIQTSKLPTITFRDNAGRTVELATGADGTYLVPVGESPIYFEGGALDARISP